MKKLFFYLSVNIMLVCCTSNKDASVLLFNNISFKLNDGEKVVTVDTKKKEVYNAYFDKGNVQIPLFKCIKANNYTIFIGLPLNSSIKELSNDSLALNLNQTYFQSDSTKYFYKTYRSSNEYHAVYAKNFDNNLVYVLATSPSALISDSLFNMQSLSNRFHK